MSDHKIITHLLHHQMSGREFGAGEEWIQRRIQLQLPLVIGTNEYNYSQEYDDASPQTEIKSGTDTSEEIRSFAS